MNIDKIKKLETYYLKHDHVISKEEDWQILLTAGTQINFHSKLREGSKVYYVFNVYNSFVRIKLDESHINEYVADFESDIIRSAKE